MRLPYLDIRLVLRRAIAGERRLVIAKFDHDISRTALAFDAVELAATHDITSAEFLEDREIGRCIRIVAFLIVAVDAPDPIPFCHFGSPFRYQTACVISATMASAAALASTASSTGRPTTR